MPVNQGRLAYRVVDPSAKWPQTCRQEADHRDIARAAMREEWEERLRDRFCGRALAVVLVACSTILSSTDLRADSVSDFYHGKTLRMIIGSAAGAGYDLTGRLLANHMSRHIPGNPAIVVENMPGASSLVMTNYLYNNAPRDGTVIGMPASGIMLEPRLHLLTREGGKAQFDINRLGWIGTPMQDPEVLWVYGNAPIHTFSDLKTNPIIVGATATGADNYILPLILNQVLGTQMKIVPGYKGQNDIFVAAERGEVQGNSTGLPNLVLSEPDWLKQHKARILVQFGTKRVKSLPDVPTAAELAASDEDRQMLLFYALKFNMARPLAASPDVPPERLEALRAAFDATMQDPQFLDDAHRLGFEIDPLGGKEIAKDMQSIADAPQDMVDRLRKLIAP
jgi:tripartite-type tricarboxylate transporter receptor subunit TctC